MIVYSFSQTVCEEKHSKFQFLNPSWATLVYWFFLVMQSIVWVESDSFSCCANIIYYHIFIVVKEHWTMILERISSRVPTNVKKMIVGILMW